MPQQFVAPADSVNSVTDYYAESIPTGNTMAYLENVSHKGQGHMDCCSIGCPS